MKLLEFPHSHYCEKARWALDYKGIPFQAVPVMPGFHIITVRQHAPETSVPVLLNHDEAVQGSSEIIDYLEQKYPACSLTPSDARQRQACLEIEHNVNHRLGDNLRRVLYDGLLPYPDFIRYCFAHPMPEYKQLIVRLTYPILRYKIYQKYVTSPQRVAEARRDFEVDMNELAMKLMHRQYLVGGQFTRADLSVASMLSLLVKPPEHPFPWPEYPNAETRAFCDDYREHPVTQWVGKIYRDHRR